MVLFPTLWVCDSAVTVGAHGVLDVVQGQDPRRAPDPLQHNLGTGTGHERTATHTIMSGTIQRCVVFVLLLSTVTVIFEYLSLYISSYS